MTFRPVSMATFFGLRSVGMRIGGGAQVQQAALLGCLMDPGVIVAVAVEDDALMGG